MSEAMMVSGTQLIREERLRQIEVEGWTAEHDSKHDKGELAAAAAHLIEAYFDSTPGSYRDVVVESVQWTDNSWIKDLYEKHSEVRALVVAGALIAAEIDRLNRQNGG